MSGSFQVPPGLICCTTWGHVTFEMAQGLLDTQQFNLSKGLQNISYRYIPGGLIEKARNDACRAMMAEGAQWLLFIDGDMQFAPDATLKLLQTAYHDAPHLDVAGAYCNLRGEMAIPTIDTGTGTWEIHYPGEGVKEVMRTGGAFLLIKRHVLERLPQPWFRTRASQRPLDALAELDTYARIKFDGGNPLRNLPGNPWERLEQAATQDNQPGDWIPTEVGEDSNFCDRVRNAGFRIGVDTNIVIGHLHRQSVGWEAMHQAIEKRERDARCLVGLTG